jgi:2-amino-4-hydroxy-6-hydroxymethyldihydropteridine diphosphokinase
LKDLSDNKIFLIGVGSNINPEKNIIRALELLTVQVKVLKIASIWQTPAVGSQGTDYLNTAILIESKLLPAELKNAVLSKIEIKLDRIRSSDKNADRTIDLDVIMHDGNCIDKDLWSQAHIAVPASEIVPDCQNTQTGESLLEISNELLQNSNFILRNDLDTYISNLKL